MFIEYKADSIEQYERDKIKKIAIDLITKIKNSNNENFVSRIGLNKNYLMEYDCDKK